MSRDTQPFQRFDPMERTFFEKGKIFTEVLIRLDFKRLRIKLALKVPVPKSLEIIKLIDVVNKIMMIPSKNINKCVSMY